MGSDLQPMVRVLFYDHNLGMLVLKDFTHAHVRTRTRTHIQKTHRVGNPAVAAPEGTCLSVMPPLSCLPSEVWSI